MEAQEQCVRAKMLATKMYLLGKIISINTACGITTCGVSACRLKKEKGHIFYCNLWKFKSCGDSLFPVHPLDILS